jgi:hypothetical protein
VSHFNIINRTARQTIGLSVILLSMVWAAGGMAQTDCLTKYASGFVNWQTGKITAIGKAVPADSRDTSIERVPHLARANANRHVIDILKQIRISPELDVGTYAAKNDIILAGMEKTAWDAVVTQQLYTSAFAVEIHIETSMYGGFLQLVLPEEIRQIPTINPDVSQKQAGKKKQKIATGLVIDARKLNMSPVLTPVVVSEQGHDVYSSVFISREFAVQNGVCKYVCDMQTALNDKRVGNYPLVVKGIRKQAQTQAIVISMADYHILEKTTERHQFLAECRVVIVID